MTDSGFEERIIFSPAFGAATLWCFARGYFNASGNTEGPDLPLIQIALPLAYHQRTATVLNRAQYSGGILRALERVPDISSNVSERADDLSGTTWQSLNLACASGLLRKERSESWPHYVPGIMNLPKDFRPDDVSLRAILSTSERLGFWLAGEKRETIWAYLDMRY